ncbi:putative MO25-like protein [Vigna angularis]|uniref:Putative MO25-like protein n=1 Tax=Phaseolus angularis TaxID=3914 RepID=A0A8T0L9Z9_PHAAN|nr:putative MO25-like protein [Vigna angularis]
MEGMNETVEMMKAMMMTREKMRKAVREEEAEIGVCASKPKGPKRGSSSEAVVFSPPDSPAMKSLFKSKPRTPSDIVRHTRDLLRLTNRDDDKTAELTKNLREMKSILYGNSESEPVPEACAQLTQEFFKENTLRLLIQCLPKLNLEARKDATQIVANLQRQQVQSKLIASDYLETNLDLMDVLISGYENMDMALHYGAMLRECIRHQIVAKYVLDSPHMKKFFDYIQLPNFDIAADAGATFKELLMRHKSTVAEFLSKNYEWVDSLEECLICEGLMFFDEYNSKLLESSNYITRRQAVKVLGDMLLDRSNSAVMTQYVSSRDNLRILMNLLRESSKSIQIEAFHVFKLFVANQKKPADIISILVANRSKLLRLLGDLKIAKEDEQFEADKAQVIREIAALEPRDIA